MVEDMPILLEKKGKKTIVNFKKVDEVRKRVDSRSLYSILKPYKSRLVCVIERSQAMGTEGSVSLFNYGEGYGRVMGVLDSLGIRYMEVPPITWKNKMNIHGDKHISISRCQEIIPSSKQFIHLRKHDGRADSLLLAVYCLDYVKSDDWRKNG